MEYPKINEFYDIIIVGAGLAGLTLASALKAFSFSVLIVDAKSASISAPQNIKDTRAIALSYTSCNILQGLKLWPLLKNDATSIQQVHISDQGHFGFSRINAKDYHVPALGYVIPIQTLVSVLEHSLAINMPSSFAILRPAVLESLEYKDSEYELQLNVENQAQRVKAKLVVAADGQASTLAKILKLEKVEKDYQQHAIVANLGLTRNHLHIAYERFTPWGAIAMLPAKEHCTTVLTLPSHDVTRWLDMNADAFLSEVQSAFGYRLGRFQWLGQRQSYPLRLSVATTPEKKGVIFLGNSSHTLHPIAAQGFNLGLRDIATLVELIAHSDELNAEAIAKSYTAFRTSDYKLQTRFTHSLTQIFGDDNPLLALGRNCGLLLFDHLKPVKNFVAKKMMGYHEPMNRLLWGEDISAHE